GIRLGSFQGRQELGPRRLWRLRRATAWRILPAPAKPVGALHDIQVDDQRGGRLYRRQRTESAVESSGRGSAGYFVDRDESPSKLRHAVESQRSAADPSGYN